MMTMTNHIVIAINPFTANPVKALHFAILVSPSVFNFWHLGALALRTERQSAQMSKIKSGGLDQYGAGPFEHQQFGTAGFEGVKSIIICSAYITCISKWNKNYATE